MGAYGLYVEGFAHYVETLRRAGLKRVSCHFDMANRSPSYPRHHESICYLHRDEIFNVNVFHSSNLGERLPEVSRNFMK